MTHRHIPTLTAVPDFTPEDRRALDRQSPAYVCHMDGGYAVTNLGGTVKCTSLDDAKRMAYVHNQVNGFIADPVMLRDPERADVTS